MPISESPSAPTLYTPRMADLFNTCAGRLAALAGTGAVADLDQLARLITERYLPEAVKVCREHGTPWAEVGKQLGTSRQNAQQRFGG